MVLIWNASWITMLIWWLGGTLLLTIPLLAYAAIKYRLNPLPILASLPFTQYTGLFSSGSTVRAMVVELVLVPLNLAKGMTVFKRGTQQAAGLPSPPSSGWCW